MELIVLCKTPEKSGAVQRMPAGKEVFCFMRKWLLIMRMISIIFLTTALQVSAKTYSQELSISGKNLKLEHVFRLIEQQTGYAVVYQESLIQQSQKITLHLTNASLQEVMAKCLEGQHLSWLIRGEFIIIRKGSPAPVADSAKQDRMADIRISGAVTTEAGAPILGVSVMLKGLQRGTVTDADGKFILNIPDEKAVLVFSFVGYLSQEVTVGAKTSFAILLKPDIANMEGVVVSALGIRKNARSVTYASQQISGSDITTVKEPNFMNSMTGKIAGLVITKGSQGPGSSSRILLRGSKSFTGNNQPLYVIDGIPMNNANGRQTAGGLYGTFDGGDAISNINPEDIENVQVLKGASGAALYGSQAANGVVLVTTKRGKRSEGRVNFSSADIFEKPIELPHMQTTYGQSDPTLLDGWGQKITNGSDAFIKDFYNTGQNYINTISFEKGNNTSQVYLSFANTISKGVVPENHLSKNNYTIKGSTSLFNDKLQLEGSVNYIQQKVFNRPQAGFNFNPMYSLYSFPTGDDFSKYSGNNFEVWNSTRQLYAQNWPYLNQMQQNPYWIQKRNPNDIFRDRFISAATLKYQFFDWLNLQGRVSYDKVSDSYEQRVFATTDPVLAGANGGYVKELTNMNQLYTDVLLNGSGNLGKDFSLAATLGFSNTENNTSVLSFASTVATSLLYPNFFSIYALNGAFTKTEGLRKQLNQAAFGSASIGYKKMIYLDLTGRNEWSSTVSQSFFYPSVGLSYILTQSLKPGSILSFAKLRASYAEVGNTLPFGWANPAPPYSLDINGNISGRSNIPYFNGTDTAQLKPERTKSYEWGADLALFKGKLNLNLTYYSITTYDQVFTIAAPAGSGATNFYINGGAIRNRGFEAVISYDQYFGEVKWTGTLNLSKNSNQIRQLSDLLKTDQFVLTNSNDTRFVGLFLKRPKDGKYWSYGDLFGQVTQKDEHGNIVTDANGLPVLSPAADQYIGNANPKFLAGFNNRFTYKNISLSFLVDGRFGGGVVSLTQRLLDYRGLSERTAEARDKGGVMVNGKQVDTKSYYYRMTGTLNLGDASQYYYSATNVRLRELSIGYTLPKFSNVIKEVNVSAVGRNLFFFYKNAPLDPEVSINSSNNLQGVEGYTIPTTRSYGITVRASF